MRLVMTSRLGHKVEHEVRRIGSTIYETVGGSKLVLQVEKGVVWLMGGHAEFGRVDSRLDRLQSAIGYWIHGDFHDYVPPKNLGRLDNIYPGA